MSDVLADILAGGSPSMEQIVSGLGARLPLLHELENTPQDREWHAEGNVLIHTGMVLDELYTLLDTQLTGLSLAARAALLIAAALHDIAKPLATREREIDGRVRVVCPRHELRGRSYLALELAGALPFSILQQAMSMTGYHNAPKLLVVRSKSAGAYQKLSRHVDMEQVYWLEQADMRGRICHDKEAQLEHLEMFKMFSQEYSCWQTMREHRWVESVRDALSSYSPATIDLVMANAIRDSEAGTITVVEEAIAKSYGYREEFPEVVVPVGISGCGKTTWIQNHLADHELVSLDEIRASLSRREDQENNSTVVRIAKEQLREHLRAKRKIVWDATSLRTDFRSAVIDLAIDYGALVTIVAFHCPPDVLAQRNKTRKHPVPAAVRLKQATSAQWPEVSESHRFLDIDEKGELLRAQGFHGPLPYGVQKLA